MRGGVHQTRRCRRRVTRHTLAGALHEHACACGRRSPPRTARLPQRPRPAPAVASGWAAARPVQRRAAGARAPTCKAAATAASSSSSARRRLERRAVALGQLAVDERRVEARRRGSRRRRAPTGRTGWSSGCRPPRIRASARRMRASAWRAIVAPGDQLRDQRVVVDRHLEAFGGAAVVAHAGPVRHAQPHDAARARAGSRCRDPRRRRGTRWRGRAARAAPRGRA